jgi:hypothetical protein
MGTRRMPRRPQYRSAQQFDVGHLQLGCARHGVDRRYGITEWVSARNVQGGPGGRRDDHTVHRLNLVVLVAVRQRANPIRRAAIVVEDLGGCVAVNPLGAVKCRS